MRNSLQKLRKRQYASPGRCWDFTVTFQLIYSRISSRSSFLICHVYIVVFTVFVAFGLTEFSQLKNNVCTISRALTSLVSMSPCRCMAYHSEAILSTRHPGCSAHEYAGRRLSAHRKCSCFVVVECRPWFGALMCIG